MTRREAGHKWDSCPEDSSDSDERWSGAAKPPNSSKNLELGQERLRGVCIYWKADVGSGFLRHLPSKQNFMFYQEDLIMQDPDESQMLLPKEWVDFEVHKTEKTAILITKPGGLPLHHEPHEILKKSPSRSPRGNDTEQSDLSTEPSNFNEDLSRNTPCLSDSSQATSPKSKNEQSPKKVQPLRLGVILIEEEVEDGWINVHVVPRIKRLTRQRLGGRRLKKQLETEKKAPSTPVRKTSSPSDLEKTRRSATFDYPTDQPSTSGIGSASHPNRRNAHKYLKKTASEKSIYRNVGMNLKQPEPSTVRIQSRRQQPPLHRESAVERRSECQRFSHEPGTYGGNTGSEDNYKEKNRNTAKECGQKTRQSPDSGKFEYSFQPRQPLGSSGNRSTQSSINMSLSGSTQDHGEPAYVFDARRPPPHTRFDPRENVKPKSSVYAPVDDQHMWIGKTAKSLTSSASSGHFPPNSQMRGVQLVDQRNPNSLQQNVREKHYSTKYGETQKQIPVISRSVIRSDLRTRNVTLEPRFPTSNYPPGHDRQHLAATQVDQVARTSRIKRSGSPKVGGSINPSGQIVSSEQMRIYPAVHGEVANIRSTAKLHRQDARDAIPQGSYPVLDSVYGSHQTGGVSNVHNMRFALSDAEYLHCGNEVDHLANAMGRVGIQNTGTSENVTQVIDTGASFTTSSNYIDPHRFDDRAQQQSRLDEIVPGQNRQIVHPLSGAVQIPTEPLTVAVPEDIMYNSSFQSVQQPVFQTEHGVYDTISSQFFANQAGGTISSAAVCHCSIPTNIIPMGSVYTQAQPAAPCKPTYAMQYGHPGQVGNEDVTVKPGSSFTPVDVAPGNYYAPNVFVPAGNSYINQRMVLQGQNRVLTGAHYQLAPNSSPRYHTQLQPRAIVTTVGPSPFAMTPSPFPSPFPSPALLTPGGDIYEDRHMVPWTTYGTYSRDSVVLSVRDIDADSLRSGASTPIFYTGPIRSDIGYPGAGRPRMMSMCMSPAEDASRVLVPEIRLLEPADIAAEVAAREAIIETATAVGEAVIKDSPHQTPRGR